MELASLSDLLGLEGLKEVTAYALKTNYCHSFHKVSWCSSNSAVFSHLFHSLAPAASMEFSKFSR
jgi:hypothetical protein